MAAARTSFDLSAAAMRRASRSDFVDDPTVVRLSLRKCYHSVRTSDRRCQRKPPPELRAGGRALGSVGRRVQRDRAARLRRLLESGFARDGELDRYLPPAGLNVVLREGVGTGAEREHERAQGKHSFHANLQSGSYAALRALPARSSRPAATSALRMRSISA